MENKLTFQAKQYSPETLGDGGVLGMVLGLRRLLKCRVEPSMITDGMITDADSTLGVEASQETFPEMCEGIVKSCDSDLQRDATCQACPSNGPKLSLLSGYFLRNRRKIRLES